MKTITIKKSIPEKVTNYINLLNYNVESRKSLVFEAMSRFGKDSNITKTYEDEFLIYDLKYTEARNNLTKMYVPTKIQKYTNWNLDYHTSVLTINCESNPITIAYAAKEADEFTEEYVTDGVLDKKIEKLLTGIYSQNFTDELGLVDNKCENSCNCSK